MYRPLGQGHLEAVIVRLILVREPFDEPKIWEALCGTHAQSYGSGTRFRESLVRHLGTRIGCTVASAR